MGKSCAVSSDFEFLALSFDSVPLCTVCLNVPVHLLLLLSLSFTSSSMYSACLPFSVGHEKGAKGALMNILFYRTTKQLFCSPVF
jgi:hypothetical protein